MKKIITQSLSTIVLMFLVSTGVQAHVNGVQSGKAEEIVLKTGNYGSNSNGCLVQIAQSQSEKYIMVAFTSRDFKRGLSCSETNRLLIFNQTSNQPNTFFHAGGLQPLYIINPDSFVQNSVLYIKE